VKVLMKKEMKTALTVMIILIITTLIGTLAETLHLSGLLYIITLLFTTPAWILITIISIIYVIYLNIKPNKNKK